MAHTVGCHCIAIDPLERYFAVGSADSLVSLWNIKDMLCVRTFTKLEWPVQKASFNHTGKYIASSSEDLFIDIVFSRYLGSKVHSITSMGKLCYFACLEVLSFESGLDIQCGY